MNISLPDTPKNPAPRPIHDRIAGNDAKRKVIMKWYADRNKKKKQKNKALTPLPRRQSLNQAEETEQTVSTIQP